MATSDVQEPSRTAEDKSGECDTTVGSVVVFGWVVINESLERPSCSTCTHSLPTLVLCVGTEIMF